MKDNDTTLQVYKKHIKELRAENIKLKNENKKIFETLSVMNENLTGHDIGSTRPIKDYILNVYTYLESIISRMPCYVYWKNKNFVYLGCNDLTATLLKLPSRKAVVGMTDYDFGWKKKVVNEFRKIDQSIIRTGEPQLNLEDVVPNEHGQLVTLLVNKMPMFDDKGNIIGIVGISIDITDRKKAERQLKQAKEAAEAVSKMKTEFLQNMGHDLRTPLGGILGATKILQKAARSGKEKELFDDLTLSATKLLSLINEILEITELEFSEKEEHIVMFNMQVLINNIMGLMKSEANCKHLKLIVNYPEDVPIWFRGDKIRIHRILLNLVSNAMKFTHKGYIKISISLIEKSNKQCKLQLVIEDTGIGIPQDKYDIIFERFSRLESAYKGNYEGMGLGLSIVRDMIAKIHGNISVKSQVGRGTTFFCNFPLRMCAKQDLQKNEKQFKEKLQSRPFLQNTSDISDILLVEDDEICRRVTKLLLEEMGFTVDGAGSGKEVMERIEKPYDLILMDMGLPDTDGLTLTQEIRNYPGENQKTLIIALTGHMLDECCSECLQKGMDYILYKPLDEKKLMEFLKKLSTN